MCRRFGIWSCPTCSIPQKRLNTLLKRALVVMRSHKEAGACRCSWWLVAGGWLWLWLLLLLSLSLLLLVDNGS